MQQTVPLLVVSEIERSRSFYVDGLGFEVIHQWRPQGALAWCWLTHGDAALMLQQACDEDPPSTTWGQGVAFYFLCDDVPQVYDLLRERGIAATPPKVAFYGMEQTFLRDPDGYQLCFENQVGSVE